MKDSQLHQAELFTRRNRAITCNLCWNRCDIRKDEMGLCNTRVNREGNLYTLTYGNLSAVESRPIEVKPFYHFLPSSTSMTFSTYSCNLQCPWCQNWHISRKPPTSHYDMIELREVVGAALDKRDSSICASLNEPALLFEYLLDLFPLAREKGLGCTMVSNGYMMPRALKELIEAGLTAINFDIKNEWSFYRSGEIIRVWRNIKYAIRKGVHVEVVKLMVTGLDDNQQAIEEIMENHLKYAGSQVPLHFTRYFPAFMYQETPTSIETLENAVRAARDKGVEFAYVGNVSGHEYESTYCPQCNKILIRRYSHRVLQNEIKDSKCPQCKKEIYGTWV